METERDEAMKAVEPAEKRFEAHDFNGALRLALHVQSFFPSNPDLPRIIAAYKVHLAATRKLRSGRPDWHSVLGIDPSAAAADHDAIKKQFKKMCLLTHPDKNPSAAAQGAFELVMQAWTVLCDTPGTSSSSQPDRADASTSGSRPPPPPPPPPPAVGVPCPYCNTSYAKQKRVGKLIKRECKECGKTTLCDSMGDCLNLRHDQAGGVVCPYCETLCSAAHFEAGQWFPKKCDQCYRRP